MESNVSMPMDFVALAEVLYCFGWIDVSIPLNVVFGGLLTPSWLWNDVLGELLTPSWPWNGVLGAQKDFKALGAFHDPKPRRQIYKIFYFFVINVLRVHLTVLSIIGVLRNGFRVGSADRQRRRKKKHLIEAAPFGRLHQML